MPAKTPVDLTRRRCVPCEGGVPKLAVARAKALLAEIPGWKLRRGRLVRDAVFEDFLTLMSFVNDMAQIAEDERHHPDFAVHYNRLDIEIWTHAIGGLSENDFILAAKLSQLLDGEAKPERTRAKPERTRAKPERTRAKPERTRAKPERTRAKPGRARPGSGRRR